MFGNLKNPAISMKLRTRFFLKKTAQFWIFWKSANSLNFPKMLAIRMKTLKKNYFYLKFVIRSTSFLISDLRYMVRNLPYTKYHENLQMYLIFQTFSPCGGRASSGSEWIGSRMMRGNEVRESRRNERKWWEEET